MWPMNSMVFRAKDVDEIPVRSPHTEAPNTDGVAYLKLAVFDQFRMLWL